MIKELREVEAALSGSATVLKADYLRWARSSDLTTQARAFRLSAIALSRISPEPTLEEQCEVMVDYLLACISRNPPPDDFLRSGFEAGHELASCLKHWSRIGGTSDVIAGVAKRVGMLYLESDAEGRNRIETGALEHILEAPRLRPYFNHWAQDAELREAYDSALEWGLAHSDDEAV